MLETVNNGVSRPGNPRVASNLGNPHGKQGSGQLLPSTSVSVSASTSTSRALTWKTLGEHPRSWKRQSSSQVATLCVENGFACTGEQSDHSYKGTPLRHGWKSWTTWIVRNQARRVECQVEADSTCDKPRFIMTMRVDTGEP